MVINDSSVYLLLVGMVQRWMLVVIVWRSEERRCCYM